MNRRGLCALLAAVMLLGGCALYSQPHTEPGSEDACAAVSSGEISEAVLSTDSTAVSAASTVSTAPSTAAVPSSAVTTTFSTVPTVTTAPATVPTSAPAVSPPSAATGWRTVNGRKFYYLPDGTPAAGKINIDGQTHYFSSTGEEILLVNPWNYVPEDYAPELVWSAGGGRVAKACDPALRKMLADCKAAGFETYLCSAYRSQDFQKNLFHSQVQTQMRKGLSYNEAVVAAGKIVAVPGTSEHQLGLAVDIMDADYQYLNSKQADMPAQKWLMEHCWEYGFILRYPKDKTAITGIVYEPWHYRYVGTELAKELHELGICLEEYIDMLTADGTSCGGAGSGS